MILIYPTRARITPIRSLTSLYRRHYSLLSELNLPKQAHEIRVKNMTNKPDLYQQGFIDGAKYAIEYLMDLFDGVEDTDIYKDYFNDEEETN